MGAADFGRHRTDEHDGRLLPQRRRPYGRDLEPPAGAVRRPGVRRLRCRPGDHRGGRDNSPRRDAGTPRPRAWGTAWTSSTPRCRPSGSWAGTGGAPRRPGSRPRTPMSRSPPGSGRESTPVAPPRRPAPPGARPRLSSSRSSGGKRPGAGSTPRWGYSVPMASSTTGRTRRAEIAAALVDLPGADWSKVRNFLSGPAEPGLPGPYATPPGVGRAATGMARGDGLAVVAASRPC